MSLCPFCQLCGYIASLVTVGMLLEEVGEKEDLENHEDNEQFDQDNRPQCLAEAHIPETVVIEVKDPVEESLSVHRRSKMILQIYTFYLKVPNVLGVSFVISAEISIFAHDFIDKGT